MFKYDFKKEQELDWPKDPIKMPNAKFKSNIDLDFESKSIELPEPKIKQSIKISVVELNGRAKKTRS